MSSMKASRSVRISRVESPDSSVTGVDVCVSLWVGGCRADQALLAGL